MRSTSTSARSSAGRVIRPSACSRPWKANSDTSGSKRSGCRPMWRRSRSGHRAPRHEPEISRRLRQCLATCARSAVRRRPRRLANARPDGHCGCRTGERGGHRCTTHARAMRQDTNERPAALVVAHPGHEVRVAGWYESARPRLFILTKGSRNGGRGRLLSARRLADRTGAKLDSLSGRYRDRDIYAAILACDPAPFLEWTAELTDAFAAFAPAMVVTDAWQMYNVGHDLTHVMARVAAERAAARLRRPIEVVEFDVVPGAFAVDRPRGAEAFRVTLDDAALLRKQASVDRYDDLRQEFEQVLACEGRDAQRQEVFRSVVPLDALVPAPGVIPPYEAYGEQRVAAGIYRDVIRWRDHVSGIIEAIRTAEPRPMAIACAS